MYGAYAAFYDTHQGDRAEHAAYVRSLIEQHHPQARRVLELACGTGAILAQLRHRYAVVGVDFSEPMLEVAREKLPDVRLIHADMTSISLDERFDVVLCVYDSINHLLRFDEWETVFDRAREHLDDDGVFIFDVNTKEKLDLFDEGRPASQWFGDGHMFWCDVRRVEGTYLWDIRVFERVGEGDYRLHTEEIRQAVFDADRIRAALEERFSDVSTYGDPSNRLHFVAAR